MKANIIKSVDGQGKTITTTTTNRRQKENVPQTFLPTLWVQYVLSWSSEYIRGDGTICECIWISQVGTPRRHVWLSVLRSKIHLQVFHVGLTAEFQNYPKTLESNYFPAPLLTLENPTVDMLNLRLRCSFCTLIKTLSSWWFKGLLAPLSSARLLRYRDLGS